MLALLLPLLAGIFDVLGEVLELIIDVLTGGPASWCGCIILIVLLIGCLAFAGVVGWVYSTCGTTNAVNFCVWFGL